MAAAAMAKPVKVVASMNDLPNREFWTVVTAGFLLAANAGFINAASMVGLFGTTVSHMTGTLTRLGVYTVQAKYDSVLHELVILLGFIFGALVAGVILRNHKFRFTRRYGVALLVESFMLYMTTVAIYTDSYVSPVIGAFWNRRNRFARVYRTQDQLLLDMDVVAAGGVTRAHVKYLFVVWTDVARLFVRHLRADHAVLARYKAAGGKPSAAAPAPKAAAQAPSAGPGSDAARQLPPANAARGNGKSDGLGEKAHASGSS